MNSHHSDIYVATEQSPDRTGVAGFFSLRLDSVGSCPADKVHARDYLAHFLSLQTDLIATLPGVGVGSAAELSFLASPRQDSPHQGQVDVLLRVRVHGSTVADAAERARIAFRNFYPNLVAVHEAYEWSPISDEAEYRRCFDLSEFRHVGEVLRRQADIQLSKIAPLPRNRPIGFHGTEVPEIDRENPEADVYAVAPFVSTFSSLERLFDILLLQPSMTLVSVALEPTNVTSAEMDFLTEQSARCEAFLHDSTSHSGRSRDSMQPLYAQASQLLEQINRFIFSLRDDCFVMAIRVVGTEPLNAALMEAVGTSVTGHVAAVDGPDEAAYKTIMRGGYDWTSPVTEDGVNAMKFRLAWIDPNPVNPGPSGRLRYLFDAQQANCAFRLPIPLAGKFPGLNTRQSRMLPPPTTVSADGLLIGESVFRGMRHPIRLFDDDRRRHAYIVGQTGTGKSSLLRSMILQDIEAGRGIAVLDPHGELVDEILPCIPKHRVDDVIYINPEMLELAVGLNMLESKGELERDRIVNQLLEIFYRLYAGVPEALGPAFELYFRNSVLLEMADSSKPPTLDGILHIFSDPGYRKSSLEHCTDPMVMGFWDLAHKSVGEYALENWGPYVTNKMSRILYNIFLRRIILQSHSTIDFSAVLNNGKILLVDLCKGRLGDTNAAFLAMLLIGQIQRAAFARTSVRDKNTMRDFYLYIDEFQNVATDSFITILSEARKYRLNAILTNQYLHQIPEDVRNAVLGNVGTIVSFRTGLRDAELLVQEFGTSVAREDLLNLPNFQAYVTTLANGEAIAPYSIRTLLDETVPDPDVAKTIVAGMPRYSTPVSQVDKAIMTRWTS